MNESYVEALQAAIRHVHGCDSHYVKTVFVKEQFMGQIVWEGNVEVFELAGHSDAPQCYCWRYRDHKPRWQYVVILKAGLVDSPLGAVQAYIASHQQ